MEPLPWSCMVPTTRHVASGATTLIVLPPVLLNPMSSPVQPEPFELDWMLAYASTTPPPDTAMLLQAVGFSASIENGNVRFWLLVATPIAPIGQFARPMTPPKIEGRVDSICTSMNPGKPTYRPWSGGM
jgi:hypothetical protein